jgi:uncharacterized protein involved in exopolysaccharide biosynthesis
MPEQARLPEVIPSGQSNNPPALAYYAPMAPQQEFEAEEPAVPLSHYIWILRRHIWKIVAFVAACVLATVIVSARLQPIYESTATVDVDRQAPSEVVGQDSTRSNTASDADQFLATQVKLIQSDSVLRPVTEQFHLLGQEGQLKTPNDEKAQVIARAPVGLSRLKVVRPPNTYLLLISYRSPDPGLAADVAHMIFASGRRPAYQPLWRSSSMS